MPQDTFSNVFMYVQRRLAAESDKYAQTTVVPQENSEMTVVEQLPAESLERVSNSRERRTRSSPTKKPQFTATEQDTCCQPDLDGSPEKSAEYGIMSNFSLDVARQGSSQEPSRRRSSRSLRVNQNCAELTANNQKLSTMPEANGAAHTSPGHQSSMLTSNKLEATVDEMSLAESAECVTIDHLRGTRSSPARKQQVTAIKQDTCHQPALDESPEKLSAEYGMTLNSLDSARQGSSPVPKRRRSSRSLRVKPSCAEPMADSQKLSTTPKANGATHASPGHQSPMLIFDKSEATVDETSPAESAERDSSGHEGRIGSSPARKQQFTAMKQDTCYQPALDDSPEKLSAEYRMTLNSSLDSARQGSSPVPKRRRSSRSLRVKPSCAEPTADSQKLPTTPKANGATLASPDRQSLMLTSDKSPQTLSVQASDQPVSRCLSPRTIMSLRNNEVVSDKLDAVANPLTGSASDGSLTGLKSVDCIPNVDDVQLPLGVVTSTADSDSSQRIPSTRRLSPRKVALSDNAVTSNPADSRQEMKSGRDSPCTNLENEQPSNNASEQPDDMSDRVALPFGAAESVKKRIRVRNRRKSSLLSGRPEEKQSRGRPRSVEPRKSSGVRHSRRNSDITETVQSQLVVADSGRRLGRPRKQIVIDNPTPCDNELNHLTSTNGEELVVSRESRDARGNDAAQIQPASVDSVQRLLRPRKQIVDNATPCDNELNNLSTNGEELMVSKELGDTKDIEDSEQRLRRPRKPSVDNQGKQTPGNNDAKVNSFDSSAAGEELVGSRELADMDVSSPAEPDDSNATSAISDDVRTAILHCYNYCACTILYCFYIL